MKRKIHIGLLPKVLVAILLGVACSWFLPMGVMRVFFTFNAVFGNFLNFIIPLIIVGLVAPGIAELGRGAGRLLGLTALLAYLSTVLAGFFSYGICRGVYPSFLQAGQFVAASAAMNEAAIAPYFTIEMPPVMGVMSALVLAFVLGLGLAAVQGETFKHVLSEFREVVTLTISKVVIPLFPLYIFGIFMKLCAEGEVGRILQVFIKVIAVIFAIHIVWLLLQFLVAGAVARKNPFRCLWNMLSAYVTALGTQSSAATIPVTLAQAKKNGVNEGIADFVIPLCATIHLSGSTLKIVACAYAIVLMGGLPGGLGTFAGFIFMLGVTMVAAPGVPGGAIMAALGLLSSMLGFDDTLLGMMIALYITMDSFGTACNVTGDGAIALIVDTVYRKKERKEAGDHA
ncbi:MAG: dicarboxylate/amino acid:cation symporter [Bacteroidales bacterium]|nr:dicarboxylate/amino acid:cation symporter [Bacteroidales bacterium]